MHFVFLTMEATNNSTLKAAAAALNARHGTGLEVSVFSLGLHNSPELWNTLSLALPTADFVFGSMLFSEEIVRPLEKLLHPLTCPVCMITSNPALVNETRLGRFSLRRAKEEESGPPGVFRQWAAKLKPKHSHGESQRQLSLVRNLSKVMKHIPGRARDIHTFIAAHQFWLNGSAENMERFLALLIDRYAEGWKGKLPQEDPIFYPDAALCHPGAEKEFLTAADFLKWQKKHSPHLTRGPVAILAMRSTVLSGNMDHLKALVEAFEAKGIRTCLAYSGGLDCRPAIRQFFNPEVPGSIRPALLLNATGFSLVGGPAENKAPEAVEMLQKLNLPCINLIPLSFQPIEQWKSGSLGLTPLQTALSIAVPELDGTIEPQVYAGTATASDRSIPLESEIRSISSRVERFLRLKETSAADKQVAIILFNFPPNLGNAGTAAFLNVFESLHQLLLEMKASGYTVEVPDSAEALRERLLEGNRLIYGTDGNVGGMLPIEDYRKLFPAYTEMEPFWGDAPGEILNDRKNFQILGCRLGNIFIGQQPSFGYERDPMRLLMAKDASPNHAFAAFYTWLEHSFNADAVVHFGTHGALEFMPGKQAGLSASCWPKRLIGSLPNFYCYSVNNPSEGAIARRRGLATLISYLAPPLEQAGLYKDLRKLHDLIAAWRANPSEELALEIRELAALVDIEGGGPEEPDESFITRLNAELYQIEERMIPLGLHVMGEAPPPDSLCDHLALIASHARPELDGKSLPEAIAAHLQKNFRDLEQEMLHDRAAQEAWHEITAISHEAVRRFTGRLQEQSNSRSAQSNGHSVSMKQRLEGSLPVRIAEADGYLQEKAGMKPQELQRLWHFLQRIMVNLADNPELQAVLNALEGHYTPPSPGNDLVRNPEIVPTGRNIHSLDPYAMPSPAAVTAGKRSAEALLAAYREEHGDLPRSIALVLWGTDNLKSEGEGVAQALALLGARTKTDELGKIADVELIPLKELGRPRIDTVMTISGIFRDLLSVQVRLLDRAARLAAAADEPPEMNFVRQHVLEEMQTGNCPMEDASNRVYSNAPGSYGANVNHLVESSSWEDEQELADAFTSRKGFAVTAAGEWLECPDALRSALKHVNLAYQNIDSAEIGISDIDHYYEYLGGVSKSVERIAGTRPGIMVGDSTGPGGRQRISSLEKMVSLEARTKLLNPKWYDAMLEQGYEGVREIEAHLGNTYGWSATASAVQNWTYRQFNETYLQDKEMLERLRKLNPHATISMTRRLLEANSRGFWETDEDTLEELRKLYADLESHIEGTGQEGH
ncbi:magnesium chelatase subunit H [Chlorobium phaeovibrioides]|uniref:magnesium chelatase n=1 Tax=Chlorobium phaeovibrioides TaxID=1094 RepID=A0A432AU76_CHLPH|nr:magnesium chelatase subunit H [Chlorobium phaeovibrioides]MWV53586.1 magnesium chelatase subunit H [Chlorobium phaeovibrioides]RTY37870.1 magnesium chelatase subunit H [Chlorobium phaeovibrioides]